VIRIATRASDLAKWQAGFVADRLRALDASRSTTFVTHVTQGDRERNDPLSAIGGTGVFTAEIDRALLRNEADVAVHSLKDLPLRAADGLVLAAIPERGPVEDVLVAANGATIEELPSGARVGTSSPRRERILRAIRPDLSIVDVRGNVPTRLDRVGHDLDAVLLARAGRLRLGLGERVTEVLGPPQWLPAPGQGALAVVVRESDEEHRRIVAALDHAPTRAAVETERAVLAALGGGCSMPLGVSATRVGAGWRVASVLFDDDGVRHDDAREGTDPLALARASADALLAKGAFR
jgi:hydroxymethylbilane synthase